MLRPLGQEYWNVRTTWPLELHRFMSHPLPPLAAAGSYVLAEPTNDLAAGSVAAGSVAAAAEPAAAEPTAGIALSFGSAIAVAPHPLRLHR